MLAFTRKTTPQIAQIVEFVNVMTYDLMNRRDEATTHHAGVANSHVSIQAYLDRGFPADKMNLGLAFYARWFNTDPDAVSGNSNVQDNAGPVSIKTTIVEDPDTSADLGQAGAVV